MATETFVPLSSHSDRKLEADRRVEARIKATLLDAFPGAIAAYVDAFARDNFKSNPAKFIRELNVFIQRKVWLGLPEIPQASQEGWKFHRRAPLRTFNDDDMAEKHMCVAEAILLSAMRPAEAANYIIDIVENETLKSNFVAMKHEMAAAGKDPQELLLFHGTHSNNLGPILSGNFDPNCIRRVAHGHGFYFSEFPATSLGYGQSLIFCRVLPGKAQTDGHKFEPNTHDSFQVPEGMAYAEGVPANMHVVKHRNQILPICVVHLKTPQAAPASYYGASQPAAPVTLSNGKGYTLKRVDDFSVFDENDKAHMAGRMVLSRLLRMNQRPEHVNIYGQVQSNLVGSVRQQNRWSRTTQGHVMSSVVYVENEEASSAFQSMKEQLAEDRASTKEILLFHHVNVWGPGFFTKSEFASCDLLRSNEFGEGFMLTDWLDLNFPHASIVVVYRVLLGRMQSKGQKLDPFTYNSFKVKRNVTSNQEQYTYVVSSEYQLLPYCVAVIKNDESRRKIVTKIMLNVEPHLSCDGLGAVADQEDACLVCNRSDVDLMEWFGCLSACSLCADFFRRICIGSNFFVTPPDCQYKFKCQHILGCRACRLNNCLEAGMTAASLAAHFGLAEVHRLEVARQLQAFRDKVKTVQDQAEATTSSSSN